LAADGLENLEQFHYPPHDCLAKIAVGEFELFGKAKDAPIKMLWRLIVICKGRRFIKIVK
jgi:hypothetical protein